MRPRKLIVVTCACKLIQVYHPQKGCKRCGADLWLYVSTASFKPQQKSMETR